MDKKSRITLLVVVALIAVGGLAWAWWPEGAQRVDPAIVQAAAEGARKTAETEPTAPEPPVVKGRARPGSLGGPTAP